MENKEQKYIEKEYYSQDNTPKKKKAPLGGLGTALINLVKGFFDSVQTLVIALTLFVVIYAWFLSPHQVSGTSMEPNFDDGEILLADKFFSKMSPYKRGDVIIFKYNDSRDFIKRIIGLPGEKVKLSNGKVYINGNVLNEPYIPAGVETYSKNPQFLKDEEEKEVPANSYFVLGDNREASSDSRVIGFINPDTHEIKGRVWVVYWPINRARIQSEVHY